MSLKEEVFAEVAEQLKIDSSDLDEMSSVGKVENWDSIGHLNLMVFLGEKYGFEVDAGVLAEYQTLGDIYNLIKSNNDM